MSNNTIIRNWAEFCEHLGEDSDSSVARISRRLYKAVGCGPSLHVVLSQKRRVRRVAMVFLQDVRKDGRLWVGGIPISGWTKHATAKGWRRLPLPVCQLLGVDPRKHVTEKTHTVRGYARSFANFVKKNPAPDREGWGYVEWVGQCRIWFHGITVVNKMPGKNTLMFTVRAEVQDGPELVPLYAHSEAPKGWERRVAGVCVGSIVEGSDVEIDRPPHLFPFSAASFDEMVDGVDKEASFYWKRDNTNNYVFQKDGKPAGWMTQTQFERAKWDADIPKHIRRAFFNYLFPKGGGVGGGVSMNEFKPFGPKGWTVREDVDCSTY